MADNKEIIKCPACGETMTKVFMPSQGVNLDVCVNGCGGIYFDNREFSKFDEPHENIEPLIEILKNKEFKKVDETQTRKCPVCHSVMVKNFASAKKEVQVDDCYSCGGKFLDYNELNKIRNQYPTEEARISDILKMMYSDLGIEGLTPYKLTENKNNHRKGGLIGLLIGIIAAAVFLYKSNKIINLASGNTELLSSLTIAAGICLIFTGIGTLFTKNNGKI